MVKRLKTFFSSRGGKAILLAGVITSAHAAGHYFARDLAIATQVNIAGTLVFLTSVLVLIYMVE